ncbi:mechanosensitive ion channel domain-containing protein [Kangiella sp.]|uniref:mechanosensitive ion channel family protein n=1 Tax=Kangiella sp. TaxID=1920245 RepID=UPI0019A7CCE6|nr:mechanosensitive ion channel domain-containing protein [Kangiella sp.]MBD3652485.1 mechanosensitive ion channel [Kangiella sp.]
MKLPVDTAQITSFAEKGWQIVLEYTPKVVSALVVLIVGLIIIRMIVNGVRKGFEKKNFDITLQRFLVSMISILLKAALAITVIGMLGIQMTTFVAMLGAAGLAIGLALSGTLQNFAGGVILLILRPYRVGDFVEMQGHSGTVKEIQIFNTILTTPDNKTIIIPNSPISTGSMINYSTQPKRRVDFTIGIGYDDDIDKARDVILGVINKDERVHKDPEPFIAVSALADSSVNFVLRVWADSGDYWGVYFENLEAIKKALDANNISIPYPQRDVHLHTVEK